MARPLHRGRIAEGGSRAQLNGRQEEDDRPSHSSNSNYIFLPHSARLWIKQQIYSHLFSPVSYKCSSKFSPKSSENGDNFSTSLALSPSPSPSPDPKDIASLDSNMGPTSSSISSNPARDRMLKWFVLCVITLFVLIALLGSTSSSSSWLSASTSPSESMYRNYRRLREQVMIDTSIFSLGLTRPKELALCTRDRGDFIPCYNVSANVLAGYMNGEEYDRHCDLSRSRQPCLVRAPKDYKIPLKWPTGKDVIWSGNVKITKDQLLSSGSMTKRLMLLEENQISFRSEDALVVDGVKDYSHQIAEMIGLHDDSEFIQAGVRTVLDIGCGFGSFGAHLFSRNLLTMCIAAYEIYGSQVQLALERGLPAMIGAFISSQLPYPSLSYDVVHCARCGVDWHQKGGTLLIEVDRVLKPGGYFVWTSPLTNPQGAMLSIENQNNWKFVEDFTQKICWDFLSQQDETAVWQKTKDKDCYASRKLGDVPPVCKMGQDLESPYYQPLPSCIGGTLSRRWIPVQNQTRWPARITLSSSELAIHGIQAEEFIEDSRAWKLALKDYWSLLTPLIFSDHPKRPGEEDPLPPFNMLRNVMDMNARYGGFNDALLEAGKTVWVMNVIPTSTSNTLPVILDRGFVGVLHNWCDAFPTYPRTYDMLHAAGLLSEELYSRDKCGIADLLLEMDRILRPEGWVVLRDKLHVIEEARAITAQMRWDARVVELEGDNGERLLVCQKPFLKK